jgi:hypothetical protein
MSCRLFLIGKQFLSCKTSDLGLLMRCLFCITFCFFTNFALAWTTKEVFAKYPNQYFIETGSHCGDGIQAAIESGFCQIYSIELQEEFYDRCVVRFGLHPATSNQEHLFYGDSADVLALILQEIDAPATFWLDGHYSGEGTGRANSNTPLLKELELIARHPIRTHTILIDDVRCFGTIAFDFISLEEVKQKILSINPSYEFSFENGFVDNDVLVARILESI